MYVSIMQYTNSPLKQLGFSPAELFFNRILKTKVPICEQLLKPKLLDVKEKLNEKKKKQTFYFDRNTKPLPEIEINDPVGVWNHRRKCWLPGKILELHSSPKSYIIKDDRGFLFRRNRKDLKKLSRTIDIPFALVEDDDKVNEFDNSVCKSPVKADDQVITRSGRVVKPPERLEYS